ncbi:hypothetical protein QBC46DRAFT_350253 [Diplogelasinospora grovesii]|uniref:F-box domain-containing protein n=1 Tax=Diplogelasinospora grovesii TaxID=303347 RepID=A0AAN6NG57_9PEZI|nr:hypothetical protein QBC46DRAFT_350253 [Diplogelasinospora grovesii]
MVTLTHLPPEIVHNILSYVDPEDLASLCLTCRYFSNYVPGNRALWRDIYHNLLDEPPTNDLDWESELHDLTRLRHICRRKGTDKRNELPFVYETVTRLLKHSASSSSSSSRPQSSSGCSSGVGVSVGGRCSRSVTYPPSRNTAILSSLFRKEANREAFLSRSLIFERARGEANRFSDPPKAEHQMSAKLHSLYGMPQLKLGRTRSSRLYPFAVSKVYDLRQYTEESLWGPFIADRSGRVDWEKIEAILLVLRSNIKDKNLDTFPIFSNYWNVPYAGAWPGAYVPWPPDRERTELDKRDPYDVSGTWLRVICFLDYNDFFRYNFPVSDDLPANVPRPALDVGEATRLILMKIHVTKIEEDDKRGGGPVTTHFKGFSRSLDGSWDENANSDLRGMCRMTPEGEVRWTTWSIFSGEERWRSEGIQLGGVRSSRGVVGNWFDKDYDPQGPVGPTAFWKVSDREPNSDDQQVLLHDFLPIVDGYEDTEDHDHDHDHEGPGGELEMDLFDVEDGLHSEHHHHHHHHHLMEVMPRTFSDDDDDDDE